VRGRQPPLEAGARRNHLKGAQFPFITEGLGMETSATDKARVGGLNTEGSW
jgi:hypothetical protein